MFASGKAVAAAWVTARAAIGSTVGKDAKGNYGKYATLAAVMDIITPALAANKLALIQETELNETTVTVAATILHESGETIEFVPLTMPTAQRTAQAVGSAITYARRYQLVGIFGLAPDDDDGQAAQPTTAPQNARVSQSTTPAPSAPQPAPVAVENPFLGTLAPQEIDLIDSWDTPADAYAWAIEAGACANEFEAKNSMKKVVEAQFAGKLTKANMRAALSAFYSRQQEKLLTPA